MTRPVNYDSTMLLRLSAEMKQAFMPPVRLVALYQANTLDS